MPKVPSPCIGVCKFKRQGHCLGCSMTKSQKSMFKRLKSNKHRGGFVGMLVAQQTVLGKYRHWVHRYRRKLDKRGIKIALPE